MPEILVEKKDHVGIIIFNRPEKMNTISGAMLAGLSESLVALDRDDDIRVIVLTGAGKASTANRDRESAESARWRARSICATRHPRCFTTSRSR